MQNKLPGPVSDEVCWASTVGPGIIKVDRFVHGWFMEERKCLWNLMNRHMDGWMSW